MVEIRQAFEQAERIGMAAAARGRIGEFGRAVEEMTVETLAARQPQTAYAQQLLTASAGFRRAG